MAVPAGLGARTGRDGEQPGPGVSAVPRPAAHARLRWERADELGPWLGPLCDTQDATEIRKPVTRAFPQPDLFPVPVDGRLPESTELADRLGAAGLQWLDPAPGQGRNGQAPTC